MRKKDDGKIYKLQAVLMINICCNLCMMIQTVKYCHCFNTNHINKISFHIILNNVTMLLAFMAVNLVDELGAYVIGFD